MTTGDSESPHSSHGGDSDGGAITDNFKSVDSSHLTENGTKESSVKSKSRIKMDLSSMTRIVQVANIAPQSTRDQMQALFGYVGKIEDLRLFPTVDLGMHHTSKICFVKFQESSSVGVAQHLTNTVFVDRALIVIPYMGVEIPDEAKALELLASGTLLPGIADPKLPQHVTSQLEGIPPHQVVVTRDPKLLENQLPSYPNLPPTFDSRRIEEIRRTIMIANLDPELSAHDVMEFFSNAGEIKYIRLCTRDNDPLHYALIEFSDQPSVLESLKFNGTPLGSKRIKVYHATQAIIKPQAKTNEAAQKEIEEAMSHQAQTLLTHGLDAGTTKDKRRSRSVSRGRHSGRSGPRVKSRSRSARRRSRSPRRSRSRSPRRIRRSRSRGRVRRSPSPARGRSRRSRSRERYRRSTSRSHRSKRSASKKREKKSKRDKDKEKEKDRTKERENGVKKEEDSSQRSDIKEESERDRGREKRRSSPTRLAKERNHSPSHDKKRTKSKRKKKEDSDKEEYSE